MNKKYIKAFDGLRVLALLGVFFYHLISTYVPSGFFGVVIFFVLAGFLSMIPIVDNDEPQGIYKGLDKILNKIKKLYPALLITVSLVTIMMLVYFRKFLSNYSIDIISSIFSINNYSQILQKTSYFEAMNSLKPLTHLWALALEFQFYVLFYLLIFPFYKKENKNKFLIVFAILFCISIVLCFILALNNTSITRIYYGMDTRISTFLVGMILCLIAPNIKDKIVKLGNIKNILEIVLFVILIALMFVEMEKNVSIVCGLTVYSLLCGLMMLLLYCDTYNEDKNVLGTNGILYKILSSNYANIIVKRSYVVYLVHYSLIVFANRMLAHTQMNYFLYVVLLIVLTIIISEAIYRIVLLVYTNEKNIVTKISFTTVMLLFLFVSIVVIEFGGIKGEAYTGIPVATESEVVEEEVPTSSWIENYIDNVATENNLTFKNESTNSDNSTYASGEINPNDYHIIEVKQRINKVNRKIGGPAYLTEDEYFRFRNVKVTLLGDSLSGCAKGSLTLYFPNIYIEAAGSRQLSGAVELYDKTDAKGEIGDVLVIALGTNSTGDIDTDALQTIYDKLDGKLMVIPTVVIPNLGQEKERNKDLRNFAATHENCVIADWNIAMKKHSEYFMVDNTHPTGLGCDAFAQVIFKATKDGLEWRKHEDTWDYYGNTKEKIFSLNLNGDVGDTIKFGQYYQDNSEEKQDIEWIVLDKNDKEKKKLLISKKALDCKKFNEEYTMINWKKCSLRIWLNEDFYNDALNVVGDKFVLTSNIENLSNPEFASGRETGGTEDKVFVPSYEEIKKYLDDSMLKCKGTEYFKFNGGFVEDAEGFKGNCDWWLRTQGDGERHVMNVTSEGEIMMKGDYVNTDDFGVRPMIWIKYD